MASPILVTGTHRSGTTWVGRMLDLSPTAHYVHEPFAPMYQRSWLRERPETQYLFLPPEAENAYEQDLVRIAALRPPLQTLLRRSRDPRDVVRAIEQVVRAGAVRRRGGRAIIKDPFALLMAEWIYARTAADVIVCVRHPAAFASSIKRLGWRLDERWLLSQDGLMADELAPWATALAEADGLDLIDHACLVWRVLNSVVIRLQADHPDWTVTRYEDLALDPVNGFERVYGRCGLEWTEQIGWRIRAMNSPGNATEVERGRAGGVVRDSRNAIWTWRDRLTPAEIDRVRRATSDVAEVWYGDSQWWPPQ